MTRPGGARSRNTAARPFFTAVALAAAAAGTLAGCGGSAGTHSASGGLSGTLQVLVSSAPGSDAGFRAVNAAFEKKYPNVHVQFTTVSNANFSQVQATRLTSGNIDVTVLNPLPMPVPSYVPKTAQTTTDKEALAGDWVDLKNLPFEKRVVPSVLAATSFNGHQYDLPLGLSYYTGVYYSKAVFAKYHLSIPTTWSQFVALCATLRKDGITPLGIGGKDSWPAGLPMLAAVQGLYPTEQDKLALNKGLWTGSAKLTDAPQAQVLQLENTIYGFAQPDFPGVPYQATPSEFTSGKFAMDPDGTWDEPTIAATNPQFSFGYFPIPTSQVAADNATLGGKVDLSLGIPANSKNIPAAEAYLDFITEPGSYTTFLSNSGFAPVEQGITVSPFLKSIAKYTSTYSPAWDQVFNPNPAAGTNAAFPFNYTGLAPMGSLNTSAAAAASQKDWAAGLSAVKA